MSKFDRRNQARQRQHNKHQEHAKSLSVFSGRDGAPRIVALIPLCVGGDSEKAIQSLNSSIDLKTGAPVNGLLRTRVERFKQNIEYVTVSRDLVAALDVCRVADFVVFLFSADKEVDERGESLLKSIESQGVSNVLTVVQGLEGTEPPKRRKDVSLSLKNYITHFFPDQEKVFSLDSGPDCSHIIRSLCVRTPQGIRWRENRSWMLVEEVQWPVDSVDEFGDVVLTGVIRGKGLKADRLVEVGDWGEFQISKVTAASFRVPPKLKGDAMAMDDQVEEKVLEAPTTAQDDLEELAPEEALMKDAHEMLSSETGQERRGVLLDDHHYFEDDEVHVAPPPRRLPKGTSAYQSAWYLDEVSDSGSDLDEDVDMGDNGSANFPTLPQDGGGGLAAAVPQPTELTPSEAPPSEMFLDPSPASEAEAKQLAEFRSRQKDEDEDLEFPDEIELHPNVLARERLARYRGLKSLRTSHWETSEDQAHEPSEWARLLQVPNYPASLSAATREALVGGADAGTRVHVYLRKVPLSLSKTHDPTRPLALFSLLKHERKHAALNFSITLSSTAPSLKSKEELILQCGFRRFVINPLFSQQGHTPNDVHKFDRYLHPGRSGIASVTGPLTWGAVPCLYFKRSSDNDELTLIGTGTSLPPSNTRVIAKRVILTGHPYKIHKKLVTVRYMFFNKEDVAWFKALQLWTRRGRSGNIKESLGTHGYFKATFDGKVGPLDAVAVSLYKRMWPRTVRRWTETEKTAEQGKERMVLET
ncbi:MAG: hypothetical protein M1824_006430 [Vezdaea acicularis]|nr:MAG: hypothetical protein M1824_006430 [Vezdaea acicularis]